jgi:hypothetical protein
MCIYRNDDAGVVQPRRAESAVVERISAGQTTRVAMPLFSSSQTLAESWLTTKLCRFDPICVK